PVMRGLMLIAGFAGVEVEREEPSPAAALLGHGFLLLFGHEAGHRGEQERSKAAPLGISIGQVDLFQERGEEVLCQIAGVLGRAAAAAYECINRIPIRLAKLFQRRPRLLALLSRRSDD